MREATNVRNSRPSRRCPNARAILIVVALAAGANAQQPLPISFAFEPSAPLVIDPKLPDAQVPLAVAAHGVSGDIRVVVRLEQPGGQPVQIWSALVPNKQQPSYVWDGRLPAPPGSIGPYVAPGSYELVFDVTDSATNVTRSARRALHVVRLGITEISARPSGANTEWQMVYFKRGTSTVPQFYATPSAHEYRNVADTGELADLDRNDGSPRTSVPVHTGTASPPMEGSAYEDDRYNFPLCYRAGALPVLRLRFGTTCIGANGLPVGAGYPIPGVLLRCVPASTYGRFRGDTVGIAAGSTATFVGPPLPAEAGATDLTMFWTFQASTDGSDWSAVPGRIRTEHRIYTVLGTPRFGGAAGVQHSGPWVEVMHYLDTWRRALGVDTSTAAGVAEALTKGFGGQVPGVDLPIENVRYDTVILGGDGGASHYYYTSHTVQLARLLDGATNGLFVNCSDCASALSAMMGMAGLQGVQMQRLGPMTLRAIRGIGAPNYTLALWGSTYSHGFSYHHIVTRHGGTRVCDACLWVDEDGNPNALPGTPGFNVDRPWNGTPTGYETLVATGPITFLLQPLPSLQ